MLNKWQIIQHAPSPRAKKVAAARTSFRNEVRGKAKVKERKREGEQERRQLEQRMADPCSAKRWWKLIPHSGCAATTVGERWQGDPRGASVKTGVQERGGASLPVAQQSDFSLFLLRFLHSKNAMETWLLGCWIPKQTFLFFFPFYFLRNKTKWNVDLKLKMEVGI